jgi:hypothetical protein
MDTDLGVVILGAASERHRRGSRIAMGNPRRNEKRFYRYDPHGEQDG